MFYGVLKEGYYNYSIYKMKSDLYTKLITLTMKIKEQVKSCKAISIKRGKLKSLMDDTDKLFEKVDKVDKFCTKTEFKELQDQFKDLYNRFTEIKNEKE